MSGMQEAVAERLRVLRARLGLSLVEAAERTGVARHTIAALERGKRAPYFPTVEKLAQGYGVSAEEILGIHGDSHREVEQLASLVKPEAPPESKEAERSLLYVDVISTLIDGQAADIESWKHEQTAEAGVLDPADLPEDEFRRFVDEASLTVRTAARVFDAVFRNGLAELLRLEATLRAAKVEELARFEVALNRFSRAILSMATERVVRRLAGLAEEGKVSDNLVDLFAAAGGRQAA